MDLPARALASTVARISMIASLTMAVAALLPDALMREDPENASVPIINEEQVLVGILATPLTRPIARMRVRPGCVEGSSRVRLSFP